MNIGWMTVDWHVDPETNVTAPESSGFYRCLVPCEGLARQGHRTTIGRSMKATRWGWSLLNPITDKLMTPDVLIIQRWMDAEGQYAVRWAQKAGQLVLADIDDWMFGLHHDNIAHRQMQAQLENSPLSNLDRYAEMLQAVDGVICSTPYLADRIADNFNPNVVVVRNAIDMTRWPDPPVHGNSPGWTGAVHWRSRDLEILKGVIKPILDHHDVPFSFLGFDGDDEMVAQGWQLPSLHERIGVDREQIRHARGCGPLEYPERLRTSDIGIGLVPLNDHPFNHAKSTVKGMEYAAAGIPFIASDLPEYHWMLDTYGIGLIASRPSRWLRHLDDLLHDPDRRNKIARENRLKVAEMDISLRGQDWIEGIETLAAGACKKTTRRATLLPA